jgi:hypothetical protein
VRISHRYGGILVAIVVAVVCIALALFVWHLRLHSVMRMSSFGLIQVGSWVPYLTGMAVIVVATFAAYVRITPIVVVLLVVLTSLFLMSLRTVEFDALAGVIEEHWAGVAVSSAELVGLDDQGYCYDPRALTIQFQRKGTSQQFSYFRGIWPSRYSDDDVLAGTGVRRCGGG